MAVRERIRDAFYDFYSSEKPVILHGVLLLVVGVAGGLGNYLATSHPTWSLAFWSLAIFWFSVALILIGIRAALLFRYKDIRLFLVRATGILMDKRLEIRNVSFRARSISRLLDFVERHAAPPGLERLGEEVAEDFYRHFAHQYAVQSRRFDKLGAAEKLKELAQYDSTSGMGLFRTEVRGETPVELELKIINSVATINGRPGLCAFFLGYLRTLTSLAFNRPLRCQETACAAVTRGRSDCVFRVYE